MRSLGSKDTGCERRMVGGATGRELIGLARNEPNLAKKVVYNKERDAVLWRRERLITRSFFWPGRDRGRNCAGRRVCFENLYHEDMELDSEYFWAKEKSWGSAVHVELV